MFQIQPTRGRPPDTRFYSFPRKREEKRFKRIISESRRHALCRRDLKLSTHCRGWYLDFSHALSRGRYFGLVHLRNSIAYNFVALPRIPYKFVGILRRRPPKG